MNYAEASLDDLYSELSRELGGEFGLGEGTPEQGKTLFDRAWAQVSESVCNNEVVRVLVQDRQNVVADQITLGALLATQFTVALGSLVNVALLVAIAARLGVKVLCLGHWSNQRSTPGS